MPTRSERDLKRFADKHGVYLSMHGAYEIAGGRRYIATVTGARYQVDAPSVNVARIALLAHLGVRIPGGFTMEVDEYYAADHKVVRRFHDHEGKGPTDEQIRERFRLSEQRKWDDAFSQIRTWQ